jgi:integrase
MKLTAAEVKSLKCPPDKSSIKVFDGHGLFIIVKSNGSKLWRYKYKFGKKEHELALGKFPDVSLADARKAHQQAKALLVQGISPVEERRERKKSALTEHAVFGVVALAWWEKENSRWTNETAKKYKGYIDKDLKRLSKLTLDKIDYSIISKIMIALETADTPKKASSVLSVIRRVFNYAQAKEFINRNPTIGIKLSDLLRPMPDVEPRAAITDLDQLRELIQDIDSNKLGTFLSQEALKLAPRVFLRPVEIRSLKWKYIKFEQKRIFLPIEVMKKNREFIVPMSCQVIEQLREIQKHTGRGEYVFPNAIDSSKFMSKNVLTNRLRALGYAADIMSAHGFRSTSATIIVEELEYDEVVVDTQLAHLVGTKTSRAYIRAKYLRSRTKMMQEWCDYLEELKSQ